MQEADWFSNVGAPWDGEARVLGSWPEAIASCLDRSWQELILEASNQYASRVQQSDMGRFSEWNDMMLSLKPVAQSLVAEKTKSLLNIQDIPEKVIRTMEWDMMHLLLEAENADIVKPGFFAAQSFWYTNGRFPCGYEGRFPDGLRVIF